MFDKRLERGLHATTNLPSGNFRCKCGYTHPPKRERDGPDVTLWVRPNGDIWPLTGVFVKDDEPEVVPDSIF